MLTRECQQDTGASISLNVSPELPCCSPPDLVSTEEMLPIKAQSILFIQPGHDVPLAYPSERAIRAAGASCAPTGSFCNVPSRSDDYAHDLVVTATVTEAGPSRFNSEILAVICRFAIGQYNLFWGRVALITTRPATTRGRP